MPFRLEPHPIARSQAVAYTPLSAGTTVLSTGPLAAVLIESEKGRRCDMCFRARRELQRCTGCKYYWYCDSTCQLQAWEAHHRRLCKHLPSFVISEAFLSLPSLGRHHSFLLAHLLAEHAKALCSAFSDQQFASPDLSDPIIVLLSLVPQTGNRSTDYKLPPLIEIPDSLINFVSSRFSNNNFVIYSSRMDAIAHGIFPLASRSFNHSCVPSAVPVYLMPSSSKGITMNVQLLRDLKPGEEITIPYTDPALPHSLRRRNLKETYGFTCTCPLCMRDFPDYALSFSASDLANIETLLREGVLPSLIRHDYAGIESARQRDDYIAAYHPSCLPSLTEAFSRMSHDGPYDTAVRKGETLLALYCLVYPANYPMIGLHALELAKTCWNAFISDESPPAVLRDIEVYLTLAERTFLVLFGDAAVSGGTDDSEPFSELKSLKTMVGAELGRVIE